MADGPFTGAPVLQKINEEKAYGLDNAWQPSWSLDVTAVS